jgi:DNA-binding SARP family transcriptional activator
MRIHAAMGNKVELVRQYERCEQTLRKEVGLPPSTQTRELYELLTR